MEARKLQQVGASYLLSVPKHWVDNNGLKKGSMILVHERADGMLIIDPGLAEDPLRQRSEILEASNVAREILAGYLAGNDVIEINLGDAMTPALKREVKRMAEFLVGVEIMEEDASKMTLQCLIPRSINAITYLRRTYGIVTKMHEDAIRAFIRNDQELAQDVIDRDREVDRLYFLVVRQLRKAIASPIGDHLLSPLNLLDYRLVAKEVEAIADGCASIAEQLQSKDYVIPPRQFSQILRKLSEQVVSAHREAISAVLQQDNTRARHVIALKETTNALVTEITEFLAKQDMTVLPVYDRVVHNLERIFESSIDIADLVI
ncbi:MAG: PhoU domain-containing protein [Promethearchaeota archaeon]